MKKCRRGLVLSGGAALGAYQAGILRAFKEFDVEFEIISATSIGSLHAFAWNIGHIVPDLDQHWLENVAGLKPFDFGRLLRGQNPFQFPETLNAIADRYRADYPFDDEKAEVLITLADYETQQSRVFSSRDPDLTNDEKEHILKASTAILHIGARALEIKGRRYFDGGYINNLPIAPLNDYDLDEVWIVLLTPLMIRGARARPYWQSALVRNLSSSVSHPYLRSLVGLLDQAVHPTNLYQGSSQKIIFAPGMFGQPNLINARMALLFSVENIQLLLDSGLEDGRRGCEQYLRYC